MEKNKIDKGKLEKELEKELKEIAKELKLKETAVKNSQKYILLNTTLDNLSTKKWDLKRELNNLEKPIYMKYVYDSRPNWVGKRIFETKDIKPSVKQGIKTGLGITNISHISEYDFKKIVQNLINKDLEKIKIQIKKLQDEIKDTGKQVSKCIDEQNKLCAEGLNALYKKRVKIRDKLHNEKYLKYKRTEEKEKEVKKKIDEHLPKLMNKIVKDVNKGLILEGLED